jgi:RND family efflux transporter MFP subunit
MVSHRIFIGLLQLVTFASAAAAASSAPIGQEPKPDAAASMYAGGGTLRGSLRSFLRPAVDLNLPARAAGVLEAIHVPEGDPVKAGQVIMSLDSDQERAEVAQAEAAVRGSKAEMDRAAAEFNRIEGLHGGDGEKIYSEKQYLDAKAQALVTRAKYDQSVGMLQMAQARLTNRSVTSPIAGIFLKTNKQVGEAVERYETIAHVVDVTSLEMLVYCDARYFALFKTGQSVDVRVFKSTDDEPILPGIIVHTDPIVDPSSGTFRVKIKIERSEHAVPGLSAKLIEPTAASIRSPH